MEKTNPNTNKGSIRLSNEEVTTVDYVKKQISESNKKLDRLIFEGVIHLKAISKANEIRVSHQHLVNAETRARVIASHEAQAAEAESKFDEIIAKWTSLEQLNDPLHINEAILEQKKECDVLLRKKDEFIEKMKKEVYNAHKQFDKGLGQQKDDIIFLSERTYNQIKTIRTAFEKHFLTVQSVVESEQKKYLTQRYSLWNDLYKQCQQVATEIINERVNLRNDLFQELTSVETACHEEIRESSNAYELATQKVRLEVQKLKPLLLTNSEKLEYNTIVLENRQEENRYVQGEHKKSIMQALLKNAQLRKDMQELRKDLGSKIKQYQTKLEKVKKDILDIETKADNFATKNDKIFNDIWALNREEAMRLMEDLFLIDKMLHQQQLEPVLTSSRPNESENSKITLDKNAPAQKRPIFGTKPPSTPETNNNLSPEQEETDLFEETASTPSLSSQDNKVHLKRASNIEKTGYMPPPPPLPIDVNKMKLEINRINELDRIHNMPMGRNFFGPFLRSQTEKLRKTYLRDRDNMPGPSNIPFKRRKKMRIAGMASDSEDDVNPLNEMKSVTNCIVENTLNKLNVDEVKPNKDDVIEFNVVPAEEPAVEIKKETIEADVNMEIDNADSMKSGSLSSPIDVPYESLSDPFNDTCRISISIDESSIDPDPNFSSSEPSGNESVPFLSNFSSGGLLSDLDAFSSVQFESETNRFFEECVDLDGELNTIAQASREAIIDANSVQDLLDDFENATSVDELNGFDIVNLGNVILVGIHSIESDNFEHEQNNNFPSWLLQILGTTVPLTELPEDALEEPHYYCQGDGLGVHPSVITVNINDELSSESSNDPNTTDFAEIDPGVSSQDMSSLPEDPVDVTDVRESLNEMRTRRLSNPIINFDANSSEMEIQTSKSC